MAIMKEYAEKEIERLKLKPLPIYPETEVYGTEYLPGYGYIERRRPTGNMLIDWKLKENIDKQIEFWEGILNLVSS